MKQKPVDIWAIGARAGQGAPTSGSAPGAEPQPKTRGARGRLSDHDRALGMGSGGPALAAAQDAARASTVDESTATIDIDADASGRVTSARVLNASSDTSTWNEVARAIVAALAGQTLRVPSGANGVVITVRIEVAMRLPSGARAGHGVALGCAEGCIGLTFDVADVAARPRRAVQGRILDERQL